MTTPQYIAVPIGTATDYKWLGVFRRLGDCGYKIFWCSSVLAEMAAKTGCGGRLLDGQGKPKTALQLCAELGVDGAWAQETLFPVLCSLAEGLWDADGGWVCTSPMASRTLAMCGGGASNLLPAPKIGGKLQFSRKLSSAEYKAWQRNCKLPAGVHLTKACPKRAKGGACPVLTGKCPVCPNICPDSENGHKRTIEAEDAEIIKYDGCPLSPQHKTKDKVKNKQQPKPDIAVVVDQSSPNQDSQNLQAAKTLLEDLPMAHRSNKLLTLLAQCLEKDVTLEALKHKITKAKNKKSPGAYLRSDLEAFMGPSGGNDWDAASHAQKKQQVERHDQMEAAKRAEAARAAEADRKALLEAQRAFLALSDATRNNLEALARAKLRDIGLDDPAPASLISMAMDISSGLILP